jgi:hypothetical protein
VRKLVNKLKPALKKGRSAVLTVAGFGFLSAAAWSFNMMLGMAAVGVSCLIVDWLVEEEKQ